MRIHPTSGRRERLSDTRTNDASVLGRLLKVGVELPLFDREGKILKVDENTLLSTKTKRQIAAIFLCQSPGWSVRLYTPDIFESAIIVGLEMFYCRSWQCIGTDSH